MSALASLSCWLVVWVEGPWLELELCISGYALLVVESAEPLEGCEFGGLPELL